VLTPPDISPDGTTADGLFAVLAGPEALKMSRLDRLVQFSGFALKTPRLRSPQRMIEDVDKLRGPQSGLGLPKSHPIGGLVRPRPDAICG
jgi:hypothetical protein